MFLSLFFIDKFYEKNVMKTYSKCEIQSNIKYVWVFVYDKIYLILIIIIIHNFNKKTYFYFGILLIFVYLLWITLIANIEG